ncbi:hypothetical protein MRB53_012573 [Persea americana]|uniref:Uncharacterized protein n=1 Tax=Persea americana TaxID=3435 RepID=A0ACC2LXQ0_PERAE|nr:hypothetical protein MRB53_012573 [Persea americana]
MEGLIPFVFNSIMKKRDGSKYKRLSNGSGRGHCSFLLLENRGSFDDSSYKRTRSDFQSSPTSEFMGWRSPGPDSHPSQTIHKRNSHQMTESKSEKRQLPSATPTISALQSLKQNPNQQSESLASKHQKRKFDLLCNMLSSPSTMINI